MKIRFFPHYFELKSKVYSMKIIKMPDNARDTVSVMRVMFKVIERRFY